MWFQIELALRAHLISAQIALHSVQLPLFITPILKSLLVPVIWLALIGAIYSWLAPFFCFNSHLFSSQWGGFTKNKTTNQIQGLLKTTD